MTLEEIKSKLTYLKNLGFIKPVYEHSGGIGNTVEKYLGIKENNISLPDLGLIELKTKQVDSSSMLTLLSNQPLPKGSARALFNAYNQLSKEDKIKRLYTTFYGNQENNRGFKATFNNDKLVVINPKKIESYWLTEDLINKIISKVNQILLVFARKKGKKKDNNVMFHYFEAHLLSGLTREKIKSAIKNGKLKFDIRIGADITGKKIGIYHDHGTGIRIHKSDYPSLFEKDIPII